MNNLPMIPGFPPDLQWLPVIDWNIKFYGAHMQQVDKGWCVPKESHIGFEINVVLEGSQETTIGGNRYMLRKGDIILIPPGFQHVNRCAANEGLTYFCAHFNVDDPHFRHEMIRNNRVVFPAQTEENIKLTAILDNWIEMARHTGEYTTADRFRLQAVMFELLGLLSQIVYSHTHHDNEKVSPASVQYAKAIAEAIKANFNPHAPKEPDMQKTYQIEKIMSSIGISTGYGLEVFRKVYGVSPRQYLSELKLQEAKVWIQQPEFSLREIAAKLGYAHLSHFSRQFKRWTGMSPLQYRVHVLK